MNIKIKNAYGIQNSLEMNTKKNGVILFAPNGCGKTSIAKLFEIASNEDSEILQFGMEENGSPDSLLVDSKNLRELKKLKNKILIFTQDELQKITQNEKFYENFIFNYIKKRELVENVDEILKPFQIFVNNFKEEFNKNTQGKIKSAEIDEFINGLSKDTKIQDTLLFIKKQYSLGNPELIEESRKNLEVLNEDLENIKKINDIIKRNSDVTLNKLVSIFENIKEGGYDFSLDVYQIFQSIHTKQLSENFGFRKNVQENFEPISKIFDNYVNEVHKKGLPKDDASFFVSQFHLIEKYPIKKNWKKIQPKVIKEIEIKISEMEIKYFQDLLASKTNFEKITKDLEFKTEKYKKIYNETIDNLNKKISLNDSLIWNIKANKIESFFEKPDVDVYHKKNVKNSSNLKSNISAGQKQILFLSLFLLDASNYDYIILDDPISSLDSDNISLALDLFQKMIENSSSNILIMTHNFSLVKTFAFKNIVPDKSNYDLFFMDSFNEDNVFAFSTEWKNISTTSKLLINPPIHFWKFPSTPC